MKLDAMVERHIKYMGQRIKDIESDIDRLVAQKETMHDEKFKLEAMINKYGNKS